MCVLQTCTLPISVRHLRVTFLNAGTFRNCRGVKNNKPCKRTHTQTCIHTHYMCHINIKHHTADLVDKRANQLCFKDVAERDPVEEPHESVQCGPH